MGWAQNIIQAALNAREKAKIGVRWPLQEMFLASKEKEVSSTLGHLKEIIAKLVNVRVVKQIESLPGVKLKIRPDFKRIGPVYGELSSNILVKLTTDSAETILKHLEEESAYHFTLEGKEVRITRDMIIVEREIPERYAAGEFKGGMVYLDLVRSLELETEGYAREIMRNLQEMRKKAGLQKIDRVIMFLKANEEMVKRLGKLKEDIEIKVGINDLEISTIKPLRAYQWNGEFKVKQEEFSAWMEKVE